jgi:hypothetical protein
MSGANSEPGEGARRGRILSRLSPSPAASLALGVTLSRKGRGKARLSDNENGWRPTAAFIHPGNTMAYSFDELVERERRRWMKPNAHLYVRPDAHRFLRPGAARFSHPDRKRFNPYGPEGKPEPVSSSARAYARPRAAFRAPAYAGRPGSVRVHLALDVGPSHSELRKLKSDLAALRVHLAVIRHEDAIRKMRGLPPLTASDLGWQIILKNFARFQADCRKAGFNPNQPRVPAGNPDGGQWTDSGGGGGGDSGAGGSVGSASVGGSPGDSGSDPPKIPRERPESALVRNRVIKEVAKWLAKAAAREVAGPVGTLLNIVEAGSWFYEAYPYVRSYLDDPKTLDELHQAVRTRDVGYDIHHIVEQTPAEQDGYPRSLIDGPENLVRVPTLKHWEITGWYMTGNEDYSGLSPRAYLRGKNWEERRQVGIEALVKHGVLKP